MARPALVRATGAVTIAILASTGIAAAASAEEAAATITLGTAEILTLPAGDGVRDTSTVALSADIPTTVTLALWVEGATSPAATLPPVTLTDGALSTSVSVPVTGLTAGDFTLVATPTVGEADTTTVTVGSGEPSTVSVSLSNATIYTWTGATPRSTSASVLATDETGLPVPFAGTVTATAGGKTYTAAITSATGAATRTYIGVSKLAAGTGSVKATVHGASATNYTSAPVTLKVLTTAVKSLTVSRSVSVVYPSKDGYKDSVSFKITPQSTTGSRIAATGKVTITRNGVVVKSWTLSSTSATTKVWDGKVGTKIIGGTYYVKVTLKGPQGVTKTATTSVKVDTGRLVSKVKTVSYKANAVLTKFDDLSTYGDSQCSKSQFTIGDIFCSGGEADGLSLWTYGSVTIPSEVVAAQKYGTRASVTLNVWDGYGSGSWGYDISAFGTKKIGALEYGGNNLGAMSLPAGASRVYITVAMGANSGIVINTIKVNYGYKVMTH